jgi:mannose-6-phosphate isomerase class I
MINFAKNLTWLVVRNRRIKFFMIKFLGSVPVTTQIDCCKNSGRGDTTFVQSEYFTVYKWDVHEQLGLEQDKPFMLVSVIVEEGAIGGGRRGEWSICKRDHFILLYSNQREHINDCITYINNKGETER